MQSLLPNRNFEHSPPSLFPPLDAIAWGFDFYGLWKTLEIAGVQQKMRWIPPGEFMMGSPTDELEREEDEVLHEVQLTKGFWFADTTCTQELWVAVTGENPSFFKGEKHPVERVSWKDVKSFLDRCIRYNDRFQLCLPTEAQWEYACRAGTTTPFSIGNIISTDQFNYDGNYPYSDGEKGLFRKETTEVKAEGFNPNYWGLFQMHGSVYEWCEDWYGEYEAGGSAIDPSEVIEGDDRVLRGGCWFNGARRCRSACRFRLAPSRRVNDIGFRFAQVDQPTAA